MDNDNGSGGLPGPKGVMEKAEEIVAVGRNHLCNQYRIEKSFVLFLFTADSKGIVLVKRSEEEDRKVDCVMLVKEQGTMSSNRRSAR